MTRRILPRLALSLWLVRLWTSAEARSFHRRHHHQALSRSNTVFSGTLWRISPPPPCCGFNANMIPRGGSAESLTMDGNDSDEDAEDDDEQDDDETQSQEPEVQNDKNPLESVIAAEPVTLTVKTNLGNALLDQSLDVLVSRTRNVASVKQTLSRQLPGRPPVDSLKLLSDGRILGDDVLVDELVDDDVDDDDDEDDNETATKGVLLILDMVPPVHPKFATDLHKMKDMTTSELIDAYSANAASMYHNAQLLFDSPNNDDDDNNNNMPLNVQLRQDAWSIRDQLLQSLPEKVMETLNEQPQSSDMVIEERRGQRYRSGKGGAKTNMRRVLQRNLNINWPDTIRNFMLFVFFGLFGGRSTVSRNLLLLGAPLCFVLQARPMKILLKQGFYAMSNPPGIFLSLLPAPQQTILSFSETKARSELYGIVPPQQNDPRLEQEEEEDLGEDDVSDAEYDEDDEDDDE